ncbi:uncharacterized protein LOC142219670 [Haematobia irritans]|uniref:uncharacterized protein LOC142219670 n=1 Tax=Haematobia irritans TaxID=7368 RepID=UPI003F5093CE
MKFLILLGVFVAAIVGSFADTKILQNVNILDGDAYRNEQFSLKNPDTVDEELIIDGSYGHNFTPLDGQAGPYKLHVTYVADKDGYHVKYTYGPLPPTLAVSPSTLKSLTG